MPYANEHACRLKAPGGFSKKAWRRTNGSGKGMVLGVKIPTTISVIWGKLVGKDKPGDPPIPQALRFPISSWGKTPEKATKWLKDKGLWAKKLKFEKAEPKKSEKKSENDLDNTAGLAVVLNGEELEIHIDLSEEVD